MKRAKIAFLVATLAFALFLPYAWTRRVGRAAHERYTMALADAAVINGQVNETVLGGPLGITRSFDRLAELLRATDRVHARLKTPPDFLSSSAGRELVRHVERSAAFERPRKADVLRFASEHAALAASMQILGPETMTLARRVEDLGGSRAFGDSVRAVRAQLLELGGGDTGQVAAIEGTVAALRVEAAKWDAVDRESALSIIYHVEKVLKRRLAVTSLTGTIVARERGQLTRNIEMAYHQGVSEARSTSERHGALLFVLALSMLGSAAAYVIARLRASAEELGAASTRLSSALVLLNTERAKEKELPELKTRFVAMTSHEFRTPLSVILSSAELLQSYGEKWGHERRSEHLARIRRAVQGMTTMLDRVLLIGKTEAGMLEFSPVRLQLDELVREIAQTAELADGQRGRIRTDITADVAGARADEKLLRHVLENLLSNALKYSPGGEPVRFAVSREGDDVVFIVEDKGIGIPEADRPRLFDGFHRATNTANISGTGLGLAVVKRAVELHGGSVSFTSVVDGGTTFTVRVRAEMGDR